MKIRSSREYFETTITSAQAELEFFGAQGRGLGLPTKISNNKCFDKECEKTHKDTVLSFLTKFKASHVKPPNAGVTDGVSGIEFDDSLHTNKKKNDGAAKFQSVNEWHHDLSLGSSTDVNNLATNIGQLHKFTVDEVMDYLLDNVDNPEWQAIRSDKKNKNFKKWNNLFRIALVKEFETSTGTKVEKHALEKEYKLDAGKIENGIKKLLKYNAIADDKKIKMVKKVIGLP
jgi:membrane-associated HD superfamily phosphohydrolase